MTRGPSAVQGNSERSFERNGVVRWMLVVVAALLLAGVAAGVLWARLAEPSGFTVAEDGASMREATAARQFGVEVVYAGLATAFGLILGALCGWRLARYGWVLVSALAVGALGAAFVSLQVGRSLGPPDPADVVSDAPVGAVVPSQLDVTATGVLLLWPLAALGGMSAAVAMSGRSTPTGSSNRLRAGPPGG